MLDLALETEYGRSRGLRVAGVDEVGRGPLAGPVVACAVILPDDISRLPAGITDSKALSAKKREWLAPQLQEVCRYGLGYASVEEIDQINILQATFLAMQRALTALGGADFALVDGNQLPKDKNLFGCPARTIVGGDAKVLSISAASVIAKVERDTYMKRIALDHPAYGWASNAGYGSAAHMAALKEHGVTEHHRRSFAPVTALVTEFA